MAIPRHYIAIPFVLAMSGCGLDPTRWTTCGMYAGTKSAIDYIDLHALQMAEDATLSSFASGVAGWAKDLTCPRLNGYLLSVGPAWSWDDSIDGPIAGKTYCQSGQVIINRAPFSRSSYQHEIAHIIQGCKPADHAGWLDAGIYDAIDHARDRVP